MNQLAPPAQLARCHRIGDNIYFRIGKAQVMDATVAALTEKVPDGDRRFDFVSGEWQVSEEHANVLEDLFVNFPAILRGQSGVYVPLGNSPHNAPAAGPFARAVSPAMPNRAVPNPDEEPQVTYIKWDNVLGYIAVALICIAIWPWLADVDSNLLPSTGAANRAASTAESAAQTTNQPLSNAQPILAATPTSAGPTAHPTPKAISAIVSSTANLRAGPGTDYEIEGQLEGGTNIRVTGQVVVPGSFSWYQLDSGLWIYSQLVGGADEVPPVVDALD